MYFNPTERSKEIRWQRPDEMVFDEYSIFRQPSLSDVKQRGLGNCWFLAVLAVLAQRPELIERLFVAKEYCSRRVFLIRLYIDGKWTTVVIDDLLPYDHNGNPLYSKPEGKQLWVPLLEKAAAKIFGCYEALDGGYESTGDYLIFFLIKIRLKYSFKYLNNEFLFEQYSKKNFFKL